MENMELQKQEFFFRLRKIRAETGVERMGGKEYRSIGHEVGVKDYKFRLP